MYKAADSGSVPLGERLPEKLNPLIVDSSPQEPEGFFNLVENPNFTIIHGEVDVPGVSRPVHYTGSLPENLVTTVPSIIVPGFGGIKGSYKGLESAMAAQAGVFTISFEPARTNTSRSNPQGIHTDTIAAIAQDLPNNTELADTTGGKDIDFTRLIPVSHSMGGIAGTKYALKHPGEVDLLVYMNSVGFELNPMFGRYITRIGPCSAIEILPGILLGEFKDLRSPATMLRISKHLLGNVVQTSGEILTCHSANLRPSLRSLGEMGIARAAIFSEKDRLVPAQSSVRDIDDFVDHYEVTPSLDHFGPQKKPTLTANRIGSIIRQFI